MSWRTCACAIATAVFTACGGGDAAPGAEIRPPTTDDNPAPRRFALVGTGADLPTGAQCAQWVQASSSGVERRPANRTANTTVGQALPNPFFPTHPDAYDPRANGALAPRVDGQFVGTTEDILRWGACKWGFDEDWVRAMAAVESWWRQTQRSNWTTHCPPDHPPGSDDPQRPQECHRDYGILQLNYEVFAAAWPHAQRSTAMNVDTALMILRTCFEGYERWLEAEARSRGGPTPYRAGDWEGCLGRYYSGQWYSTAAIDYVSRVRDALQQRVWQRPDF